MKFVYLSFILFMFSCHQQGNYRLNSVSIFPINQNQINDGIITWNSSFDFMDFEEGDSLFIFRLEISCNTHEYNPPSIDSIVSIKFLDSEGDCLNDKLSFNNSYNSIKTRRTFEDEFLNISEFNKGKGYVYYPIIHPNSIQDLMSSYNNSIMYNDTLLISNFLVLKLDSKIFAEDFTTVSVELYSKKEKKNFTIKKKVWDIL